MPCFFASVWIATASRERLQRALVVAPRALELERKRLLAGAAQPRGVLLVRMTTDLLDERLEALEQARRFELIAQHWRQRERQRRAAIEQLEQRHVAADDRLPQPLLAERPRAEALDIRHVRVQDDRQRPTLSARPRAAHRYTRHTAMKSSAASRLASAAGRIAKSATEIAGVNQS